jgi:membrane-associated phospholipid phosphatase
VPRPLALALTLPLLLAAAAPAHAEPWHHGDAGSRRVAHLVALAAGGALYAVSETVAKPSLAPDLCRWCAVNGLDDRVRTSLRWGDPASASTLSNVTGFVAAPVLTLGLTSLAAAGGAPDDRAGRILDDVIPVLETAVYSELVVQLVKFTAGRQRPYAHFAPADAVTGQDDNLSFFSGHATLTFGLAVSAGLAAHRRDSALEPVIWATGLPLAAATAYLRIAADKHYLTDVTAGAAWGTAAAFLIPRLTHALPADVSLVPQPSGLAVAGRF